MKDKKYDSECQQLTNFVKSKTVSTAHVTFDFLGHSRNPESPKTIAQRLRYIFSNINISALHMGSNICSHTQSYIYSKFKKYLHEIKAMILTIKTKII